MADTDPRAATPDDVAEMASVLGDAFTDDPVFVWLFPDAERRPSQCQALFAMTLEHRYQPAGGCQLVADAVAAWEPPADPDGATATNDVAEGGTPPVEQGAAVATEGADEAVQPGDALPPELAEAGERMGVLGALMAAHHPSEPCWYLAAIGVRPGAQGRGLGGVLLAARCAELDELRMPAFLEATTPRSRALYERHGFVATEDIVVPDGPTMWAMWREPRTAR